MAKVVISVDGMHCPSCALGMEKSLTRMSGVTSANVNFIQQRAIVDYDPGRVVPEAIKRLITQSGYSVREGILDRTRTYWKDQVFFLRMIFTGLMVIISWVLELTHIYDAQILAIGQRTFNLADIAALIAVAIGGYTVFNGAIRSLLAKDITVFSLIAIASVAAVWVGSYKEAAMVILIMLIGETLEQSALTKTRKTITELLHLTPQIALVRREDGHEINLAVEEVIVDDIVIIKPGERIPVDGVIIKGEGAINEATLTGESLCVDKKKGDSVFSGTINESGAFEVKATAIGEHTRLGLIKRLIQEAESQKAPIQRLADRYVRYFFPTILAISLAMFFVTNEVYAAITVLIAACPCALVLATPTAVVCGLNTAAKQGILIKGGQYLEALGTINTLLMDKTGTLTSGYLEVTDIIGFYGVSENEVIRLAASAEKNSEHPLARAILAKALALHISAEVIDKFEATKGLGVKALIGDRTILIGNQKWLEQNQVKVDDNIKKIIGDMIDQGKTVLVIARTYSNNGFATCGIIGIADTIRPIAAQSILELKQGGLDKIILLTGDNQSVARAMAQQSGITEFYAEMMPEDKVNKVKELKQGGYKVAMVGDGVNDAPALAAADVGIAMAAIGSAVAIESSDVSLMSDDLSKIPIAIKLSQRVRKIIKQNFIFAIIYNFVIISIVGLYIHHQSGITFGALAHQFSSLLVISNSLRLLKWSR